ncbi:MAG: hypothetical protein AB9922_12445 [Bacteroidales bacterium]
MKTTIEIKNWNEVVEIANDPNQPMPKRAIDMINVADRKATKESKDTFVEWANDCINSDALLGHDWMVELSNGSYKDFFEDK